MESSKKYIEKAQDFSKFYENNVYKDLEPISNEIVGIFKRGFERFGSDYNLVISNSVYSKIDLYDFIDRVKSPSSLEEKLVRKNLIFNLANEYDLDSINKEQSDLLKKYFCNIDDIIGIKSITSLNNDCDNVLNLLKEKASNFGDISFNFDEEIPDYMRNGRKIYKIKCKYKELYCFEFQIKSKIDSAWGDLEHNIFYKDYDFNYVKNNNKDIMNNIGGLLERVEDLMLSVRNGKKQFIDSYQKLNFKHNITNTYNEYTETNFKSKFVLEENMDKLFYIYNYNIEEYLADSPLVNENIDIPDFSELNSNIYRNYESLKRNNFEIPFLEIIYFNWMKILREDLSSEELIKGLINGLLSYQIIKLKEELSIELLENEIITDIDLIITNSIIDFENVNLLIDFHSLAEFIVLYVSSDFVKVSISENNYNDFVELDEENIEEFFIKIKETLFKCIYSMDSNIELDEDSRIFIDKLKRVIEGNKEANDNKKIQNVNKNSVNTLNLILGVGK